MCRGPANRGEQTQGAEPAGEPEAVDVGALEWQAGEIPDRMRRSAVGLRGVLQVVTDGGAIQIAQRAVQPEVGERDERDETDASGDRAETCAQLLPVTRVR